MKWLYLAIDCLTLFCPIIVELIAPTGYLKRTKAILTTISISAVPFIIWDSYFASRDIWSFNPDYSGYLSGYFSIMDWSISRLPIEEILFFFAIPYATLFIYHLVQQRGTNSYAQVHARGDNELSGNSHHNRSIRAAMTATIAFLLLAFLLLWPLLTSIPVYTRYVLWLFIPLCIYSLHYQWFVAFLITYLLHLVPFFIVNGILTATPVVLYNSSAIIGLRLGTIPLEDLIYSASLLLLNVTILETIDPRQADLQAT